jgi:N-glycosylase/DNA lyase
MQKLVKLYNEIKDKIESRIKEFDNLRENAENNDFLKELVFCLMTPQSKAKTCAKVADMLFENGAVFRVSEEELADMIRNVRFRNHKAKYIKEAIKKFEELDLKNEITSFATAKEARKWFVDNVKGFGYKEASHFLRNTGFGYELSILDRHILKNLVRYGVIEDIPKTMTPKMYEQIEEKMANFSKNIGIPMHHLDFLLWYKETKEVFK